MIAFIDAVMVFMDDFVVVGVDDLLDDLFLLMLFWFLVDEFVVVSVDDLLDDLFLLMLFWFLLMNLLWLVLMILLYAGLGGLDRKDGITLS